MLGRELSELPIKKDNLADDLIINPFSSNNNNHNLVNKIIKRSVNNENHRNDAPNETEIIDKQFILDDDFEKKIKNKKLFLQELNEFMKTRGLQTQANNVKKGSKIIDFNLGFFFCFAPSNPNLEAFKR